MNSVGKFIGAIIIGLITQIILLFFSTKIFHSYLQSQFQGFSRELLIQHFTQNPLGFLLVILIGIIIFLIPIPLTSLLTGLLLTKNGWKAGIIVSSLIPLYALFGGQFSNSLVGVLLMSFLLLVCGAFAGHLGEKLSKRYPNNVRNIDK